MKDYSVLDDLGCRMLDLKPYLKKAYDEGYKHGIKENSCRDSKNGCHHKTINELIDKIKEKKFVRDDKDDFIVATTKIIYNTALNDVINDIEDYLKYKEKTNEM